MLRDLFNALTYRTPASTPDPAAGMEVTPGRRGGRTVCDPRVPDYLDARRRRLVRDGLDPIDAALLDRATVELLRETAARMAAERDATQPAGQPGRYPVAA
jgi:hypothetical protein